MEQIGAPKGTAGAGMRPASVLAAALAGIVFWLACASDPADAQSVIPLPEAVDRAVIPEFSDIVYTLCTQFRVAPADSIKIARAVMAEADRYAMPPVLLLAVMAVESSFDRYAVSVVGARGLMQILPGAHPQLVADVRDLSDPATNVRIGSAILRGYLNDASGDLDAALFRYSGGGRGYVRRVAVRVRQFNSRFHSVPNGLTKASFQKLRGKDDPAHDQYGDASFCPTGSSRLPS